MYTGTLTAVPEFPAAPAPIPDGASLYAGTLTAVPEFPAAPAPIPDGASLYPGTPTAVPDFQVIIAALSILLLILPVAWSVMNAEAATSDEAVPEDEVSYPRWARRADLLLCWMTALVFFTAGLLDLGLLDLIIDPPLFMDFMLVLVFIACGLLWVCSGLICGLLKVPRSENRWTHWRPLLMRATIVVYLIHFMTLMMIHLSIFVHVVLFLVIAMCGLISRCADIICGLKEGPSVLKRWLARRGLLRGSEQLQVPET